jgi:hypothetical protein
MEMAITNEAIANAGNNTAHGACEMMGLFSITIIPQSGVGGCMPTPRNPNDATIMIE